MLPAVQVADELPGVLRLTLNVSSWSTCPGSPQIIPVEERQPAAARNGCSSMAPCTSWQAMRHEDKYRVSVLSAAHAAVAKVFGLDIARALVDDNPQAIVNDHPIPFLSGG